MQRAGNRYRILLQRRNLNADHCAAGIQATPWVLLFCTLTNAVGTGAIPARKGSVT